MTSTVKRKPCAKCFNAKGVAACNGCQQMFCFNHFVEHRDELSNLIDGISIEHDSLRNDSCPENLEQPYLTRIDAWEKESIKRIQVSAEEARRKVHEIFNQKRADFKHPVESLALELQSSRISNDYTENDIERWIEKLKTLQEELKSWSSVRLEEDNDSHDIVRLLKVYDRQEESSQMIIRRSLSASEASEELPPLEEKFTKDDACITLAESDSVAKYCSRRKICYTRFTYGINRYRSGRHSIRFLIDKKGESPLFFGIITGTKKYDQSYFNPNNSSVFGWYNLDTQVICGKNCTENEENTLLVGDELTLIIDCDGEQISLLHHRTKRMLQITVKMEKCPLPWKMMVGLSNINDCIRILN